MFASKFKSGDCVKLKSGGPTMTVSNAKDDTIECSWFVDGTIQHSTFTPDSLKPFQGKNAVKPVGQNV